MKAIIYAWLEEVPDFRALVWDHTIEWGEPHERLHVFSSIDYTLEEVCAIALELGDCTVVADEIDLETSSKAGLLRGTAIHSVFNYGRHHNVATLWGCRRCADIPRGLTANTNKLFVLLTHEPGDLDWLEDKTGDAELVAHASSLEVGEWLLWEAGQRKEAA
jgi:hypothetical protein